MIYMLQMVEFSKSLQVHVVFVHVVSDSLLIKLISGEMLLFFVVVVSSTAYFSSLLLIYSCSYF